jgi:hypothetical protein
METGNIICAGPNRRAQLSDKGRQTDFSNGEAAACGFIRLLSGADKS